MKEYYSGKHVIEMGSVWRVGNGQSIKIREDKWLPHVSGSKVASPPLVLPFNSKFCDLIDQESHAWKIDFFE